MQTNGRNAKWEGRGKIKENGEGIGVKKGGGNEMNGERSCRGRQIENGIGVNIFPQFTCTAPLVVWDQNECCRPR